MGRALGQITGTGFVAAARRFIGVPYVWGGESPSGFDCSGLVAYTLAHMGITGVPRTSEEQWGWVQRISQSQLQPGDLVFESWPGEAPPGHVAIYSGGNRIIEAPAPGQNVHEVPWSPGGITASGGQVIGYGRVPGMSYGGEPASGGGQQQQGSGSGCPAMLVLLPALPVIVLARWVKGVSWTGVRGRSVRRRLSGAPFLDRPRSVCVQEETDDDEGS